MGKHHKTVKLIELATEILAETHPMTVRQVYYQLVSRQVIENNRCAYGAVCNALPVARLRQRLTEAVEARMDLDALADVQREEVEDKRRLNVWFSGRK